MAVKVKSALALYQKFNVTIGVLFVWKEFHTCIKSAHKAPF